MMPFALRRAVAATAVLSSSLLAYSSAAYAAGCRARSGAGAAPALSHLQPGLSAFDRSHVP